jgi:hypothetical protein
MKTKLPIFFVILVLTSGGGWALTKLMPWHTLPSRQPWQTVASNDSDIPPAQALVAQAAKTALQHESIAARIRQRVDLYGQQLVGTGSYHQLGLPPGQMLRLNLLIDVGDRSTSLQQVCDGRFLWRRLDFDGNPQLSRVDLRRVSKLLKQSPTQVNPAQTWLELGGLSKLLSGLEQRFQFPIAQKSLLTDQSSELPVWQLTGTWKPDVLMQLLPSQADAIRGGAAADLTELPAELPQKVQLLLGQDDLFPYRIDFLREDAETGQQIAITTLELFDVEIGGAIDPLLFVYKPGDQEVTDRTQEFIEGLNLKSAEEEATTHAQTPTRRRDEIRR